MFGSEQCCMGKSAAASLATDTSKPTIVLKASGLWLNCHLDAAGSLTCLATWTEKVVVHDAVRCSVLVSVGASPTPFARLWGLPSHHLSCAFQQAGQLCILLIRIGLLASERIQARQLNAICTESRIGSTNLVCLYQHEAHWEGKDRLCIFAAHLADPSSVDSIIHYCARQCHATALPIEAVDDLQNITEIEWCNIWLLGPLAFQG